MLKIVENPFIYGRAAMDELFSTKRAACCVLLTMSGFEQNPDGKRHRAATMLEEGTTPHAEGGEETENGGTGSLNTLEPSPALTAVATRAGDISGKLCR